MLHPEVPLGALLPTMCIFMLLVVAKTMQLEFAVMALLKYAQNIYLHRWVLVL